MTNWANEIAIRLWDQYVMGKDTMTGTASRRRTAKALRKAKADGYREVADMFPQFKERADEIRARADEIEKGAP